VTSDVVSNVVLPTTRRLHIPRNVVLQGVLGLVNTLSIMHIECFTFMIFLGLTLM